jgi:sugar/nucleoside kinase (ribokinase family)
MNKKKEEIYDVITFGAASRDIFLNAKKFSVGDFKKDHIEKEILLPFGHKIEIDEIHFHSGGGGTNSATTFIKQGLKTAFCGVIGKDLEGDQILKELKNKKIETEFIVRNNQKPTNVSIIFSTPKNRTILIYRGASEFLSIKQIPWSKIKNTKWFYLAPLGKELLKTFKELINFAKDNQIKIMVNPSIFELKLNSKDLERLLKKIDILILNQEESQMLVKDNTLKEEKLVKKIKNIFPGILLIVTNGEKKIFVSAEKFLYSALPPKQKVIDTTGAGDAFGAGFLSGYIKTKGNIVYSIQVALANSANCIQKWGAKEGLLNKNQKFKKIKVKKEKVND